MAAAIESKSSLTAGNVKHTIEAFVDQNNILGVITDVRFPKVERGEKDGLAGIKLCAEIRKNDPVTVQVLGICSALAVTAKLEPAIVMGLSVTLITAFANVVISLLRKMTFSTRQASYFGRILQRLGVKSRRKTYGTYYLPGGLADSNKAVYART